MYRPVRLASLVALLGIPAFASARLSVGGDAPKVLFHATGPAGLGIDGHTSELKMADDGTSLTVTVPLANLDTGISLRNKHMKEKYLQVDKFPEAVLVVARSSLSIPADGKSAAGDATGKLTLHGRSNDVTVHYKAARKGSVYEVEGSFRLDMLDYGIEKPSYLGVTMQTGIDLTVKFQAVDG